MEKKTADGQALEYNGSKGIVRFLIFCFGLVSLGLALVTVVIRGIPTTPFLLLSGAAFSRSSPRMHGWIHNHPRLGPLLRNLKEGRGLSLKTKLFALTSAWLVLGSFAVFGSIPTATRIGFIALACLKTILMFTLIPTLDESKLEGEICQK